MKPGREDTADWIARWSYALLPSIVVVMIATLGIRERSFWYDELVTADAVENGLSGLFDHSWEYPLVPYYALMYVWTLGGTLNTDWWMRGLSVVFAIGAVIFTAVSGKAIHSRRVGFTAAFVVAISPWMAYYSQNARSYTLGAMLVAASTYFAIRGTLRAHQRVWWPYAGLLCLAAVFMQAALIVLVVHPVVFALWKEDHEWLRPWLRSALVATPLTVVSLLMYANKGADMHGWLAAPNVSALWKGLPQVTRWEPLAVILVAGAVLTRQGLAWLIGTCAGVIAIWAVSQVGASFWLDGVLGVLVSVLALAAASSMVLVSWRHALLWSLFIGLISAGNLIQLQTRFDGTRYATKLAATVSARTDDAVFVNDPNKVAVMALRHYAPRVRVRTITDDGNLQGPRWYVGDPHTCPNAEVTPLTAERSLTYCPA